MEAKNALRRIVSSAGNLRMIAYSAVIGLVAAGFAGAFFYALEWVTHLCFVTAAGVEGRSRLAGPGCV